MKVVRDTGIVFGRYFGLFIHNPVWVAVGIIQPLLYLLLFAPSLEVNRGNARISAGRCI